MPKIGTGGVAARYVLAAQRKAREESLLAEQFGIDRNPYVTRNLKGEMECRICGTSQRTVAAMVTHLGGRRHKEQEKKYLYLQARREGRVEDAARILASSAGTGRDVSAGLPSVQVLPGKTDAGLVAVVFVAVPAWAPRFAAPQVRVVRAGARDRVVVACEPYQVVAADVPRVKGEPELEWNQNNKIMKIVVNLDLD